MNITKSKKYIPDLKETTSISNSLLISSDLSIKGLYPLLTQQPELINRQDREGDTFLSYSIKRKKFDVSEFLLTSPLIDLTYQDKNGNSYLHLAIIFQSFELVQAIIKKQINLNIKNNEGNTPLHFAYNVQNEKIINYLILNGANEKIKNNLNLLPSEMRDVKIYDVIECLNNYNVYMSNNLVDLSVSLAESEEDMKFSLLQPSENKSTKEKCGKSVVSVQSISNTFNDRNMMSEQNDYMNYDYSDDDDLCNNTSRQFKKKKSKIIDNGEIYGNNENAIDFYNYSSSDEGEYKNQRSNSEVNIIVSNLSKSKIGENTKRYEENSNVTSGNKDNINNKININYDDLVNLSNDNNNITNNMGINISGSSNTIVNNNNKTFNPKESNIITKSIIVLSNEAEKGKEKTDKQINFGDTIKSPIIFDEDIFMFSSPKINEIDEINKQGGIEKVMENKTLNKVNQEKNIQNNQNNPSDASKNQKARNNKPKMKMSLGESILSFTDENTQTNIVKINAFENNHNNLQLIESKSGPFLPESGESLNTVNPTIQKPSKPSSNPFLDNHDNADSDDYNSATYNYNKLRHNNTTNLTDIDNGSSLATLDNVDKGEISNNEDKNIKITNTQLFEFLKSIKQEKYYNNIINNGFDDFSLIINQTKSGIGITDQNLFDAGIKKPGDRAKILIKLQEIAKNFPFEVNKNVYYCCENLEHYLNDPHIVKLNYWLKNIYLEGYLNNFVSNGYHSLDLLFMQTISKQPLTQNILLNELKIDKLGYRTRILNKLKEESVGYKKKLKKSVVVIDNQKLLKNCDCIIY